MLQIRGRQLQGSAQFEQQGVEPADETAGPQTDAAGFAGLGRAGGEIKEIYVILFQEL